MVSTVSPTSAVIHEQQSGLRSAPRKSRRSTEAAAADAAGIGADCAPSASLQVHDRDETLVSGVFRMKLIGHDAAHGGEMPAAVKCSSRGFRRRRRISIWRVVKLVRQAPVGNALSFASSSLCERSECWPGRGGGERRASREGSIRRNRWGRLKERITASSRRQHRRGLIRWSQPTAKVSSNCQDADAADRFRRYQPAFGFAQRQRARRRSGIVASEMIADRPVSTKVSSGTKRLSGLFRRSSRGSSRRPSAHWAPLSVARGWPRHHTSKARSPVSPAIAACRRASPGCVQCRQQRSAYAFRAPSSWSFIRRLVPGSLPIVDVLPSRAAAADREDGARSYINKTTATLRLPDGTVTPTMARPSSFGALP